jgi:hypothetical protein
LHISSKSKRITSDDAREESCARGPSLAPEIRSHTKGLDTRLVQSDWTIRLLRSTTLPIHLHSNSNTIRRHPI